MQKRPFPVESFLPIDMYASQNGRIALILSQVWLEEDKRRSEKAAKVSLAEDGLPWKLDKRPTAVAFAPFCRCSYAHMTS